MSSTINAFTSGDWNVSQIASDLLTNARENSSWTAGYLMFATHVGFHSLSKENQDTCYSLAERTCKNVLTVASATASGAIDGAVSTATLFLSIIPTAILDASREGGLLANDLEEILPHPNLQENGLTIVIAKKNQDQDENNKLEPSNNNSTVLFDLIPNLKVRSPVKTLSEVTAGVAATITSVATLGLILATAHHVISKNALPENLDFFTTLCQTRVFLPIQAVVNPVIESTTKCFNNVSFETIFDTEKFSNLGSCLFNITNTIK